LEEKKKRMCLAEDKAGGKIESKNRVSEEGYTIKPPPHKDENTLTTAQRIS
jgi:hypothetical protein